MTAKYSVMNKTCYNTMWTWLTVLNIHTVHSTVAENKVKKKLCFECLSQVNKKAKCVPQQNHFSRWWAGSQRSLQGLGLQRDESMAWQESHTLIHMVPVNSSLLDVITQRCSQHMGHKCSTWSMRKERKEPGGVWSYGSACSIASIKSTVPVLARAESSPGIIIQ